MPSLAPSIVLNETGREWYQHFEGFLLLVLMFSYRLIFYKSIRNISFLWIFLLVLIAKSYPDAKDIIAHPIHYLRRAKVKMITRSVIFNECILPCKHILRHKLSANCKFRLNFCRNTVSKLYQYDRKPPQFEFVELLKMFEKWQVSVNGIEVNIS